MTNCPTNIANIDQDCKKLPLIVCAVSVFLRNFFFYVESYLVNVSKRFANMDLKVSLVNNAIFLFSVKLWDVFLLLHRQSKKFRKNMKIVVAK